MRIWEALFGLVFSRRKQWDALLSAHTLPAHLPGESQELWAFLLSFYVALTEQPFTPPLGEVISP